MGSLQPTNSVAAFCAASEAYDVDGMVATLAPDAELISPLSGRMVFRGRDDLRVLLSATYGSLQALKWTEVLGDGAVRVAVSEGKIAGIRFTDAMVFEIDGAGQIRRLRPHLRPLLAVIMFAAVLGPKLSRRFGVVRRALWSR
jgi:hypothetical protein